MAHEHEEVRVRRLQHGLERLDGRPAGHRRMERRAAAGVDDAGSVRQAAIGRHRTQPLRLRERRLPRRFACHEGVYSISGVDGYSFVHTETARFRDLDPMGHVNNAVYLTWMENARIEFLRSLGAFDEVDASGMTMILARAEVDFRSPVTFDERVDVGVRVSRFGTKSFDLEYELRVGERVVAEAKTVLVAYDYATSSPSGDPDGMATTAGGVTSFFPP